MGVWGRYLPVPLNYYRQPIPDPASISPYAALLSSCNPLSTYLSISFHELIGPYICGNMYRILLRGSLHNRYFTFVCFAPGVVLVRVGGKGRELVPLNVLIYTPPLRIQMGNLQSMLSLEGLFKSVEGCA